MTAEELRKKRKAAKLTQQELADKVLVSKRTIVTYEQGGTIPDKTLKDLEAVLNVKDENSETPDLNKVDIGAESEISESATTSTQETTPPEDLKVISPFEHTYSKNNNENQFIALPNGQHLMIMPLAEVSVQAGFLDNFQDVEFITDLPQHSIIVDRPVQGRYCAFRVVDESMFDGTDRSIKPGFIVSGRELQRHHWRDELKIKRWQEWVIYTTQSSLPLLKHISKHDVEKGIITCHSYNPDKNRYRDFELSLNDVNALFNVVDISRGERNKEY